MLTTTGYGQWRILISTKNQIVFQKANHLGCNVQQFCYVFCDEAGDPCTVTADRYVKMLCEYLVPELRRRRVTLRNTLFQKDLATPHTSGIAQQFLETKFCERLISKGIWPARSPDIAPPDFYLFGYLKGKVYKDAPQDLEELENRIRYHLSRIPQATMTAVFQNLIKRITACKRCKGCHLQHLPLWVKFCY